MDTENNIAHLGDSGELKIYLLKVVLVHICFLLPSYFPFLVIIFPLLEEHLGPFHEIFTDDEKFPSPLHWGFPTTDLTYLWLTNGLGCKKQQ